MHQHVPQAIRAHARCDSFVEFLRDDGSLRAGIGDVVLELARRAHCIDRNDHGIGAGTGSGMANAYEDVSPGGGNVDRVSGSRRYLTKPATQQTPLLRQIIPNHSSMR